MRPKITDLAKGKWPSVLAALGVSKDHLINRHGPCPMCGGKDRFRFDNKDGRGTWFCTGCGSGDGVELVKLFLNLGFKDAAREIEKHVGGAPLTMIRQGPDEAQVRAEMERLWKTALPFAAVEEVADWWRARIGHVPALRSVRATPALRCPGAGVYPTMLAIVQAADGKAVNMHRTFLSSGGVKADCGEPRRVMQLPLPPGCAVRLALPGPVLGVAEGIETAAAAMELTGLPCWAALTADNLSKWEPPEGVKVVIFADNDRSFAGQAAAYALAKRLVHKRIDVEPPRLPPAPGMDWNDVWQATRNDPPPAQEIAA